MMTYANHHLTSRPETKRLGLMLPSSRLSKMLATLAAFAKAESRQTKYLNARLRRDAGVDEVELERRKIVDAPIIK